LIIQRFPARKDKKVSGTTAAAAAYNLRDESVMED